MALLIAITYPGGGHAIATGYPHRTLVVQIIPRGPEAAYLDEVEVDWTGDEPHPVVRVVGGPRRPTIRVRLDRDEAATEAWIAAREADGWEARVADDDPGEVWVVAGRDGLDPARLALTSSA